MYYKSVKSVQTEDQAGSERDGSEKPDHHPKIFPVTSRIASNMLVGRIESAYSKPRIRAIIGDTKRTNIRTIIPIMACRI